MTRIMCYGDSNTWGYDPDQYDSETGAFCRLAYEKRWPGILSSLLGTEFAVIEEAYNGRTTVFEDPGRAGRKALDHLPVSFYSHEPLDILIIMLGINDTKDVFSAQAGVIGWGMERLLRELKYLIPNSLSPDLKILLIAPSRLEKMKNGEYFTGFSEQSRKKTEQLPAIYEKIAHKYGCSFLNAAECTHASDVDGIHLSAANHQRLAEEIYRKIVEMLD